MFVPDSVKTNPYRVLRLSAHATLSEIHKAAANMRREALLGMGETTAADFPLLGEVPRTETDIRTAIGRLASPEQRLTDRLFWFHSVAEFIPNERVAIRHDNALRTLFTAIDADLDDAGVQFWAQALRAWHQVISEDDYWTLSLAVEEQGAFEPIALPSEIRALRDSGVRMAAEALLTAARDAFAHSQATTVRRVFVILQELADTGRWATDARREIASPALERLQELCRRVREEYGSKIIREQDGASSCWVDGQDGHGLQKVQVSRSERNKRLCDKALKTFRDEVEPALHKILELVPAEHEAAQQSREATALCLNGIASDYTWADDFITSETLRDEALQLAHETVGAIRIQEGLEEIRESARKQRIFGALTPISSAPALRTINGFGFSVYGSSDHDPNTNSYVTTYYFVALFLPVFPIARYRVINMGGSGYQFLGKLPLRKSHRWHLGISTAAIIAVLISFGASSNQGSSSAYAHSTGSTYSTSDNTLVSSSSELANLKSRIDSGRSRIEALKSQLQPVIDEINNLDARMEPLAADLKTSKEQHDAGIEIDVDGFNAKVRSYNALVKKRRALCDANGGDLQIYNDLRKQDSVLVDRYNALLK